MSTNSTRENNIPFIRIRCETKTLNFYSSIKSFIGLNTSLQFPVGTTKRTQMEYLTGRNESFLLKPVETIYLSISAASND